MIDVIRIMEQNSKAFNLISFNPIGFKIPYYPATYCDFCHGLLVESCAKCEMITEPKCIHNTFWFCAK